MKSTTASLIIALASTAIAQPHARHGGQHPARAAHQHGHPAQKRALVTEWDIEWVTEYVTEYIDASRTQFLHSTQSATSPATTLATVTTSASAGQFVEESSSSSSSSSTVVIAPVETPSSSSTYVAAPAPTTSSSSSSSEVYVAPETTSSSTSEVYVAPTTSSTTPVVVPTTSTTAAAVAATTSASSSSSGSTVDINTDVSVVLGSDYYSGDLTYYTLGLGSCGTDDSGEDMSANIVAMSSATMGAQSNGNPMCGKTIKIYNSANGKTATGTVMDKCPGCDAGSIDVSQKLFEELADLADGRVEISWNWA